MQRSFLLLPPSRFSWRESGDAAVHIERGNPLMSSASSRGDGRVHEAWHCPKMRGLCDPISCCLTLRAITTTPWKTAMGRLRIDPKLALARRLPRVCLERKGESGQGD